MLNRRAMSDFCPSGTAGTALEKQLAAIDAGKRAKSGSVDLHLPAAAADTPTPGGARLTPHACIWLHKQHYMRWHAHELKQRAAASKSGILRCCSMRHNLCSQLRSNVTSMWYCEQTGRGLRLPDSPFPRPRPMGRDMARSRQVARRQTGRLPQMCPQPPPS